MYLTIYFKVIFLKNKILYENNVFQNFNSFFNKKSSFINMYHDEPRTLFSFFFFFFFLSLSLSLSFCNVCNGRRRRRMRDACVRACVRVCVRRAYVVHAHTQRRCVWSGIRRPRQSVRILHNYTLHMHVRLYTYISVCNMIRYLRIYSCLCHTYFPYNLTFRIYLDYVSNILPEIKHK